MNSLDRPAAPQGKASRVCSQHHLVLRGATRLAALAAAACCSSGVKWSVSEAPSLHLGVVLAVLGVWGCTGTV